MKDNTPTKPGWSKVITTHFQEAAFSGIARHLKMLLAAVACYLLFMGDALAAPKILHSNMPGNNTIWLILKKEQKGRYILHVSREGAKEEESFKLDADTTAGTNTPLKFAPGDEARATNALKDVADVFAHTTPGNTDAAGDASGDINSFVNEVLRKMHPDGVFILPSAPITVAPAPEGTKGAWLWMIGGLLAGAAGGVVIARMMKQPATAQSEDEAEEDSKEIPVKPEDTLADAGAAAQKLKKAQKDLREAKAALVQSKKLSADAQARADAHDVDYKALEARLKTGDKSINELQSRLSDTLQQLSLLSQKAANQEAYFKAAATAIVRPFTDYASGSRLNPADKNSQATIEEQLLLMGIHYYSLVRYGASLWDEHDIYNLQRLDGLGKGRQAATPQTVTIDVKSGAPNLVLTIAALLRTSGATGAGLDVSIRGYKIGQ